MKLPTGSLRKRWINKLSDEDFKNLSPKDKVNYRKYQDSSRLKEGKIITLNKLKERIRELKEETNLDLSNLKLFHSKISEDKVVDVYVCTDFSGKAEAADDLQEVQWFEINELPDMKLDGNELIQKAYKEICL